MSYSNKKTGLLAFLYKNSVVNYVTSEKLKKKRNKIK